MGHLTGRAFITVAGKRLPSKPGAKLGYGNLERAGVTGDSGVLGYQEKVTVPYVECTIAHSRETSLADLAGIVDATVSFDTDSQKSFVLRQAWTAKALELDGGDIALRFEGMSCEEV